MTKKGKVKQSAKGKGTVVVLVLLFMTSASLRIATSATEVMAEARTGLQAEETLPEMQDASKDAPTDEQLSALLTAFERREQEIRQKELDIEQRMMALSVADEKISIKLEELEKAERKLRDTLALASTAAEDDLARLTTVYENMKPKTAAALFEEMAPDFAAGFIARMRPDVSASIMAGMDPQAAYTISTILAGRNANIPKN